LKLEKEAKDKATEVQKLKAEVMIFFESTKSHLSIEQRFGKGH